MNKSLILLTLVLITYPVFSQKYKKTKTQGNNSYIRWNALALVNPIEPTLAGGFQHDFHNKVAVALEGGWVIKSGYYEDHAQRSGGFIFKPSMRLYPNPDRRIYFESEFSFKRVDYQIEDWLGKDVVDNVPAYEEYKQFDYRRSTTVYSLKVGVMRSFIGKENVYIDFFGGLGLRQIREKVISDPGAVYQPQSEWLLRPATRQNETSVSIVIPIGIRILFRI